MEVEPIYINPDTPVYISYAWNREGDSLYQNIEDCVNELCDLFEKSTPKIRYKRDKADKPYRLIGFLRSIADAAEEIGRGCIIILVISGKYLESLDCLYELHCIRANGNADNRIIPIVLDDVRGDGKITIYQNKLEEKGKDIIHSIFTGDKDNLSEIKLMALSNKMFKEDFDYICKFISDKNSGSLKEFRKRNYDDIVSKIVEYTKAVEKDNRYKIEKDVHKFLYSKSILIIGDSILKYKGKDGIVNLAEYIDQQCFDNVYGQTNRNDNWKSELRKWNREKGDLEEEKLDLQNVISQLDNKKIITDNLKLLINNSTFNQIVYIGYCFDIVNKTISCEKSNISLCEMTESGWNQASGPDWKSNEDGIVLFHVIKNYEYSPKKITNIINKFLYCVEKDLNIFKRKNLLCLGTDLPGWNLRHIWTALSDMGIDTSIVLTSIVGNKLVDQKTIDYIGDHYYSYDIDSFIKIWVNLAKESLKHTRLDNNKKDVQYVYVFYLVEEYFFFNTIYQLFLSKIEQETKNVFFIWKVQAILNSNIYENAFNKCIILYEGKNDPPKKNGNNQKYKYRSELTKISDNKKMLFIYKNENHKLKNSIFRDLLSTSDVEKYKYNATTAYTTINQFIKDK